MLTQRAISSFGVDEAVYGQPPSTVLDGVAARKMVNLLKQIGELSDYAFDIFDHLFKDALVTQKRAADVVGRLNNIDAVVPRIESHFQRKTGDFFYGSSKAGKPYKRKDRFTQSLFGSDSQPASIHKRRAVAKPPPNVSWLDAFSGRPCLRSYSDPQYFLEEWVKEEEKRQEELMKQAEENRAKKKANKKRRKKAKKERVVAQIEQKVYSAQGSEFATVQKKVEPAKGIEQKSVKEEDDDDKDEEEEETTDAKPKPPRAPVAPTMPSMPMAMGMAFVSGSDDADVIPDAPTVYAPAPPPPPPPAEPEAPPPPPMDEHQGSPSNAAHHQHDEAARHAAEEYQRQMAAYELAKQQYALQQQQYLLQQQEYMQKMQEQQQQQMAAWQAQQEAMARAAIPEAPAFEPAPEAPPLEVFAPPPEAPDLGDLTSSSPSPRSAPASPRGGGGGGGGDFLTEMTKGLKLKSAAERKNLAPRKNADSRTTLMDEIKTRGQTGLKKVTAEQKERPVAAPGGGISSIMDILARRSAIEGSDDEGGADGSDDGEEWDEKD